MHRQTKSAPVVANLLSMIITQPTTQVSGGDRRPAQQPMNQLACGSQHTDASMAPQVTFIAAGNAVLGVVQYFGHQRLREGPDPIESDFTQWLEQVDEIIKTSSK
jgi:hypothetical protein